MKFSIFCTLMIIWPAETEVMVFLLCLCVGARKIVSRQS